MKKHAKLRLSSTSKLGFNTCHLGARPVNDDGYFEQMTKVIFRSGLNWDVIEKKWPDFQKAFGEFSVEKVAQFNESDLDRLMKNQGIVRNYRKVSATLENARELLVIRREHGSFVKYLKETSRDGEEALCRELTKRFSFLGGSTVVFFLRAVGEEMPETIRKREDSRMDSK
ncbi:MAG: DNA-3-methyladenine glycosylase I [Nitrospirae bacterium]|nr:DNA-3-methyladenine glycosylase I [Nitrospirota bacterium]